MQACRGGLTGLNDWRSPAYITREKHVVFTGRFSYDIVIKHFEVKTFKVE